MKQLLTIAAFALALTTRAQNFEGSITWSMKYTLSNPNVRDAADQYLPKEYTFKKKDKDFSIVTAGGGRPVEMLWLDNQHKGYRLDLDRKTWSPINSAQGRNTAATGPKATIVRTAETRKILGYECTKYIIRQADPKIPFQEVYWITNALDGLSMKKDLANLYMGTSTSLFHKDIDGMPLRIEIITATITTIAEATAIKKEPLPVSLFSIPRDFKETGSQQ